MDLEHIVDIVGHMNSQLLLFFLIKINFDLGVVVQLILIDNR
jgi:hypothetical protein